MKGTAVPSQVVGIPILMYLPHERSTPPLNPNALQLGTLGLHIQQPKA
jgi:hypothetical protein